MELRNIEEEVFSEFVKSHKYGTFLQSVNEKKLKEIYGNKTHLVGLFQDNELVGASLLLEIPTKFKKNIFYAPRGFVTDYDNYDLIKEFTLKLASYVKKHNGLEFIIDPYVIYQIRNKDASDSLNKNDKIIEFLKKLGYKHFGFNLNFEASQVRFMYRIPVFNTLDEMMQTFSKSTRKNLEDVDSYSVSIRNGERSDLDTVVSLFKASADAKDFFYRSESYYQNMMDSMEDIMKIYIAYIDFNLLNSKVLESLENEKNELNELLEYMKHVNVGTKLLKRRDLHLKHIEKYEKELENIKEYKKLYGDKLDIGALLSIKSNNEYITLTSGMLPEFRKYNPKYAMYLAHIKDAIKEKFEFVNFYGISGNFDPKSPMFGIYDLKRGFNGEIVELIGEFRYPVSVLSGIYHFVLKLRDKLKK